MLGACVFIDTAGFDDEGALGELRMQKTRETLPKADIAIMLFSDTDFSLEKCLAGSAQKQRRPGDRRGQQERFYRTPLR